MSAPTYNDPHTIEPKGNVAHFDREDTLISGDNRSTVGDDTHHETGVAGKLGSKLNTTAPKDGDLGGRWLATYTGPRPELTDELNNKVRNKIDSYLLPLIFLIYFSESH